VKFGLNVINFGPAVSAAGIASTVEWAESVGFAIAMLSDHVSVTPDVARLYPERFYEPFTTLAWLAARTTRIQLGTTVMIVPYRHPLLIQRMTSQVNEFAAGRLVLGVGVGWAREEFAALGVPFERRGSLTDAFLAGLRGDGRVAGPADAAPPVWVGGHSAAAIRRAARFADAWHPLNASLEWLAGTGLPMLRAAAEVAGRPVPAFAPRIRVDVGAGGAERRPGQGSLEEIRQRLAALADLGATYVILDTYPGKPEALHDPEVQRGPIEILLEQVIDVPGQRLR
jgi:alkanesulfonate monooxygenase SsuD/methylene tetrahydromethanopterin reductase-like flavin-dependent oxidoreductase (luciferase family)